MATKSGGRKSTAKPAAAARAVKAATKTGAEAEVSATMTALRPAKAASRTAAAARARLAAGTEAEAALPAPAKPARGSRAKLGRNDLLAAVAEQSGVKRTDVRKVLDAAFAQMNAAAATGRDLDLSPFGKLRIVKRKVGKSGETLVCRLKLDDPAAPKKPGKQPLAEPSEEG
ncbi:MAG: hypothetical protein CVT80_04770 [Alphaproteobacteria bacterium HGW-Alphaproteobacteria-2]|nr:MAG: hypothetical protein CVT80_04770 [Alphaproteobacteria bacterium HGW-Alphaproteobacteria-2]